MNRNYFSLIYDREEYFVLISVQCLFSTVYVDMQSFMGRRFREKRHTWCNLRIYAVIKNLPLTLVHCCCVIVSASLKTTQTVLSKVAIVFLKQFVLSTLHKMWYLLTPSYVSENLCNVVYQLISDITEYLDQVDYLWVIIKTLLLPIVYILRENPPPWDVIYASSSFK